MAHTTDSLTFSPDPLVANPGRLRILLALAAADADRSALEFVALRRRTGLTDGNLATHARRLHASGLVAVDKRIRDGKPVTRIELTTSGRHALEAHAEALLAALDRRAAVPASRPAPAAADESDERGPDEDDWVD